MAGSWKQFILTNDSPTFVGLTVTNYINFVDAEFNTFLGYQAGKVTTGLDNTFVGYQAGYKNADGYYNLGVGFQALYENLTGYNNTAVGWGALILNTAGYNHVAVGYQAGRTLTGGNSNTFLGYQAGYNALQKVDAVNSTALGANTYTTKSNQMVYGDTNITEHLFTAGAMLGTSLDLTGGNLDLDNTTNANQFGLITKATVRFIHDFNYGNNGTVTTTGPNIFIGNLAGNLTMGATATQTYHSSYNIGIGKSTLVANTKGYRNVAIGGDTFTSNTIGYGNVAIGINALVGNTEGYYNIGIGYLALYSITTGYYNTGIGVSAGRYIADGTTANTISNTSFYMGSGTRANADGDTNEIVIGYNAIGLGSNSVMLGNTSVLTTGLRGNVGINTSTFGTSAAAVLGIYNGTVPSTSVANEIQIFSVDSSDATATLGLFLEQAVEAIGTFTASNKIKVKINGTEYWVQLDAV